MPVDGPFYMPDPELFGHPDAYPLFTAFASGLEEAGLAGRFPMDVELRQIAIELLAERSTVEEVDADQSMIERRRCGDGSVQVERRGREAAALRDQRSPGADDGAEKGRCLRGGHSQRDEGGRHRLRLWEAVVAIATQSAPIVISCPTCGCSRFVSARQARRYEDNVGVCRSCSRGRQVHDESDKLLAFWFARFGDEDLLTLARALANRRLGGSIASVQEHRARLGVPVH